MCFILGVLCVVHGLNDITEIIYKLAILNGISNKL